jgi:multiple antibiotic resistance protein
LDDVIHAILLVFAGLFPIVNPVGDAPIFLTLTRHCNKGERHLLAGKVAVNSFILLTASLFLGSHVLEFFGITLPVLRIGGGLVVTAFGWKLLHAGDNPDEPGDGAQPNTDVDAFYPLTMPLTVGPGSISVAITIGANHPDSVRSLLINVPAILTGVALVSATVFVAYRYADRVSRAIGETGMSVLLRLSAFILLCIGVQIVWNGASALLRSLPG